MRADQAAACDTSQTALTSADVSLTKAQTGSPAFVGDQATFRVTVANDGPDLAPGVDVTDLLPTGLRFVSASPSRGTYDATTGLWAIGDLASGSSATIDIRATVETEQPVTNFAQVTGGSSVDPDSRPAEDPLGPGNPPNQDDEGAATVDVAPRIDLSVTKSVTDGPSADGTTEFTLSVANAYPIAATGVVVTDHLPAGATFVSAAPSAGTFDGASGTWDVGTVEADDTESLVVRYRLQDFPTTNLAEVTDADQVDVDSQPAEDPLDAANPPNQDDEASIDVASPFVDLSLDKSVTPPSFVGQDATFEVTVTNDGFADATGVEVTDQLPAGLTFVSASTTAGTYDDATGVWTVGDLDVGDDETLTVVATLEVAGPLTNVAEVSAADQDDVDSTPGNGLAGEDDQDSAGVTAGGASVGDRVWDDADGDGTQDDGEDGINGVTVALQGDIDGDGTYETTVGTDTTSGDGAYRFGDLSPGRYRVVVDGATLPSGFVATTATTVDVVLAAGEFVDSADFGFSSVADLSVTKSGTSSPQHVGDDATFDVVVTNDGPVGATGVVVGDPLPAGLTFVSAAPSQGAYDPATGAWTVGTLADGATATLTVTATVDDDDAIINTAEVTAVDQDDPDSTPDDHDPDDDDLDTAIVDVDPLVDLSVTKTETASPAHLGDTATFAVTVANAGPSDATDVEVSDLLPAGLTFVSAAPGVGTYDPATGVWTVGPLASGADATLQVTATVDTLSATNRAELTGAGEDDTDSTPGNDDPTEDDQDAVTTTVTPLVDLSLSKTETAGPTHIGDNARFVVTVHNDGPSTATAVEVTDLLPTGLAFDNADATQGTYDPATGVWTVGDLADGGSATLTVDVTVTAPAATNVAEVTAVDQDDIDSQPAENPLGPDDDPDQDDEGAARVDVLALVDLSVTKAETASPAHLGEEAVFEITVANAGPSDATGVAVTDLLPAGLTFVGAATATGTYDPATGVWTVGSVVSGADATLQVTARVDALSVSNTAELTALDQDDVDSSPGNGDPDEDDQDAVALAVAPRIDLSLDKAVTTAPAHRGDLAVYTVTVANAGPSDATGVQVTDQLPAGVTHVMDDAAGAYDPVTGVWDVGTVTAGGARTLAVTVTVDDLTVENFAEVTAATEDDVDSAPAEGPFGPGDPADQDDEDSAPLTVAPLADLTLAKTSTPSTVEQGDTATFTLTVTNDGPSAATAVEVTDLLPAGVTFVSSQPGQGTYDPATGIWALGTVAEGASATLDLVVTVDDAGPITNTAEITAAAEDDPDSTPANGDPSEDDQDAATLSSDPVIDLSVQKAVDVEGPMVGSDVTFTVTVGNDGPSDATGVEVTDLLPPGLTYVSDDPSQGTYDPATGRWAIGSLPVGEEVALRVSATVDDPGAIANVAEVTGADQTDTDSQPGENPLGPDAAPDQDDEASALVSGVLIDLELDIAADATVVDVGGQVTYTVTLTNQGPSAATGVSVVDLLPPGLTFVDAGPSVGSFDPVTGTWTVGGLAVGQTVTLQLVAVIEVAGPITNLAQVSGAGEPDVDSAPGNDDPAEDDQDEVTVTGAQVDLSLTKTVDDETPDLGGEATYTLTVANAGPSTATGVVVIDELPTGLTWLSDTSSGAYDPATGRWTVGTLAPGASVEIQITARTTSTGSIANRATVIEVDQPDNDSIPGNTDPSEDDDDTAVVQPQAASVSGTIWLDDDGDGSFDDDENPIGAVTVLLLDEEGDVVASTVTDDDGHYTFTDVPPGTYLIAVDETTLPATIDGQSFDPDDVVDSRHEVTLEAGQNVVDIDFGYEPVAPAPPTTTPPGTTTPGSTTPDSTTPDSTTPGSTTPGSTTPGNTTPDRPTTPGPRDPAVDAVGSPLARTGTDARRLARSGLVLTLLGAGLVLIARRRRRLA